MKRSRLAGTLGVLLAAGVVAGRQTAARPVCKDSVENLDLSLAQVRIGGAPASANDAGLYETDAGVTFAVSDQTVMSPRIQDPLVDPPENCVVTTSRIGLSMIDPFTGELVELELRRAP